MQPVTYPPTTCLSCEANLQEPGSVRVTFAGESAVPWETSGCIAKNGALSDLDKLVEAGLHAGSRCAARGELLEELPEEVGATGDEEKAWEAVPIEGSILLDEASQPEINGVSV